MEDAVTRLYGYDNVPTNSPYPFLLLSVEGMGKRRFVANTAHDPKFYDLTQSGEVERIRHHAKFFSSSDCVIDATKSSEQTQAELASLLEVPTTKFWIHADTDSTRINPTLRSKCYVYDVPYLSHSTIYQICKDAGMPDDYAEFSANLSHGRPGLAFRALQNAKSTNHIRQTLRVLTEPSTKELDELCKDASVDDLMLLKIAVVEIMTDTYVIWKKDEVAPLAAVLDQLRYVLQNSGTLPRVDYTAIMYTARLAARG